MNGEVTINLPKDAVDRIVEKRIESIQYETEQEGLALKLFQRRETIDPFVALASALKQVARQHSFSIETALELLETEARK